MSPGPGNHYGFKLIKTEIIATEEHGNISIRHSPESTRLPAVYDPSRYHRLQPVLTGFQRAIAVRVIQVIGKATYRDHLDHIESTVGTVFVDHGIITLDNLDLRLEVFIDQTGGDWRCMVRQWRRRIIRLGFQVRWGGREYRQCAAQQQQGESFEHVIKS